jgi:hypothetical protein
MHIYTSLLSSPLPSPSHPYFTVHHLLLVPRGLHRQLSHDVFRIFNNGLICTATPVREMQGA